MLLKTYFGLSTLTLIKIMVHLMGIDLYGKRKDIRDGNSHLWHQKYSLPCTNVPGFVACRVISKVLGIGESERSWGDAKTIKSGRTRVISSDVS